MIVAMVGHRFLKGLYGHNLRKVPKDAFLNDMNSADAFATTRWSLILSVGAGADDRSDAALEELCRSYWRPLYAFARRRGCSPEDAEDAVQGFFTELLRGSSLAAVDRAKGRFRSFLLNGMQNHLASEWATKQRQKRGGGVEIVPLELVHAESEFLAQKQSEYETAEHAFDRTWALALLGRARGRLRLECVASGKAAVFDALFPIEVSEAGADYATLGARLSIPESTLRSTAMRLRRRWRELIRNEVAETVTTEEALEEEMASLREVLRG